MNISEAKAKLPANWDSLDTLSRRDALNRVLNRILKDEVVIQPNKLRHQPKVDADTIASNLHADPSSLISGIIMQYDPDTLELICVKEFGDLREVAEWLAQEPIDPS